MENLKIRVNNEAESKEVQELFFKLGGKWGSGGCNIRNNDEPYLYLENGLVLYGFSAETFNAEQHKEITLQELRAMVNQDQDEPFLTPETTLNDQEARQLEIHGTVKAKPDFNFGEAQAIKVKSGSDSDHALDAMSFGLMGAGAASGGAKDNVNHPGHYADSAIECIDAMEAMMTPEQFIGYLRGNLFKYQWRYEKKNGIEDLKKAQWYLEKLIAKIAEKNAPF